MSRTKYQESVRRSTILPAFSQSLAEVHFHPHADFASLQVFTCERLNSVLTKEACAANYTRSNAPLSCKGCPIGSAHAGVDVRRTAIDVLNDPNSDRHARAAAANGLSCVRCLRSESTAKRFIGRFRLVQKAWCISCYNRTREVHSGLNSKLAKPVKWAGLRQTVITIEDAIGTWTTLEPIMTTGRAEAERYVTRCHPGSGIVDVVMDGNAVQPGDPEPMPSDWEAEAARKQKATLAPRKRKVKPLPVASDREALQSEDDCWPSCNATEVEPLEFSLDPESIAAYWDLTADGLPEFVQWLCEDWPTLKHAPEWEPSAADKAILNRELDEHLVDCGADEYPKRQQDDAAEREDLVSEEIVLEQLFIDQYAGERKANAEIMFAGKSLAEWSERTGEAVHVTPARMVETGTPFAGKLAAIQPPPVRAPVEALPEIAEPLSEPQNKPAEAIAPVRDPMAEAINKLEAIKNPSRQVRRELGRLCEKQERRAARPQQQTANHMPPTKATATAIASRALAIFDSMGAQAGK